MSTCEPLEGNADLYGLGIRIGIYLQWGSAWLSLLLDPESAQGVLDASSVSLFAVAIATVIAGSRNAPAIEIYIMLQMLLGFPITTLSSFGFRLWLMNPRRLDRLCREMARLGRQDWEKHREARQRREDRRQELQRRREQRHEDPSRSVLGNWLSDRLDAILMVQEGGDSWKEREEERRREGQQQHELPQQRRSQPRPSTQNLKSWRRVFDRWGAATVSSPQLSIAHVLWHPPVVLPLRFLSSLKFPGLSWSGVLWRTTAVALVMGYNLAYWFDESGHGVQEPPNPGCTPPTVFMFSIQSLAGPGVSLGRAAAVIIAVAVGPPTLTLLMLTLRVFAYALLFLYRDAYFLVTSGDPQSFKDILNRVNNVLGHRRLAMVQIMETHPWMLPPVTTPLLDLLEFMSAYGADSSIRFSDVIKVAVSLGMGEPVNHQSRVRDSDPCVSRAQTMPAGWRTDGAE